MAKLPEPVWRSPQGEVVACVEKLKVLRENLEEIQQLCQDALEDACGFSIFALTAALDSFLQQPRGFRLVR